MKKPVFFLVALTALLSCASAKKKPDLYSDKKMHPTDRSGLEKFLGTNRYEVLDEAVMYIDPLFGKIKAKKGNFIYRRGTDVAGYRIYYDTSAYTLELAQEPRKICCDAIDRYLDDFENKRLNKKLKPSKTKKIYGSAPGYQEYGVAISMMNYKAKPNVYFGYAFVKDNPYFVIHVAKTKNLALEGRSADLSNLETIVQNYYFTRGQAKRLKEFISEENISLFHVQEDEKLGDMKDISETDEYIENSDDAPVKVKKNKKGKKDQNDSIIENEEDYSDRDDYTEIKK